MKIRLLRGQVVVREDLKAGTEQYKHIVVPDVSSKHDRDAVARGRSWHKGVVLAMGAAAMTKKGVEVPPDFKIGDTVLFHWDHHERSWTRPWADGEPAAWMPQHCVDAVVES